MPTYDYQCDACGHLWELFQKITDDPIDRCPDCKKKKARRLFGTGAAVVFKGSGFYQTDYRSDSYKKGEKAAKEKSDGKPENKTENKSANKSESKTSSNSSASSKSDTGSNKTG